MRENTVIRERLEQLKKEMRAQGLDYYLIPTSDYHDSEYVAPYFRVREYFSGFTGSWGSLLVGADDFAGLWADGRYYIQAEREIEGTGITLFKSMSEGVPTIEEYLEEHMQRGGALGFDGMTMNASVGRKIARTLKDKDVQIRYESDLAATIWTDRPALPCGELYLLPDDISGRTFREKLSDVREAMEKDHAGTLVISRLDDIMWLTNLRGSDIECNPVALSYFVVTEQGCELFVQEAAVPSEVRSYLSDNEITLRNYRDIISYLKEIPMDGVVMADRGGISHTLYSIIKERTEEAGGKLVNRRNPTTLLKAEKNETELKHIREVYLRDSAALTKFIYYVKTHVGKEPMTEFTLSEKLDSMRAKLPGFIELSFETISAYGANAAMMHYKADKDNAATVEAKGMYLVDSGGTYMGGTTDVTRTMVLGEITEEMKKHYTITAAGMLNLASMRFLEGTSGRNLDVLARGYAWRIGEDYKCGTGHGIGYMLNVHEGPQSIRWRFAEEDDEREVALQRGMIVSDEPGVYIGGSHGIRIENILEVTEDMVNHNGTFLKFEHLTYAPIDPDAIDVQYLQPDDIERINAYQRAVWEKLSPVIEEEEILAWLKKETREIG